MIELLFPHIFNIFLRQTAAFQKMDDAQMKENDNIIKFFDRYDKVISRCERKLSQILNEVKLSQV